MVEVTISLPIGTAMRLSNWLEGQNCDRAAHDVLEAVEQQGLPQVDRAIEQLIEALGETDE